MQDGFAVSIAWDDEAKVWYVEDSDVPGLAAESDTAEGMVAKLRILVPELLELNRHLITTEIANDLPLRITAKRLEHVRLAG